MSLLSARGLALSFGGIRAVQDVSFDVDHGEIFSIIGPNGAGKTTLICMITGQFKPKSGKIFFDGRDITGWPPDKAFLAGVSRKFQVPNMYETLSVYDNVMVSLKGDRKVFKYMFKRVTPEENDRIWEILEFVDLADKANDSADMLSHGERQWLELGMLVASDPKLLLLDEPTTGMTEEGKHKTAELIQRIALNHTVLLVEHDMHIVRQIAQKVTVLHQGERLAEGSLDEVVANPTVRQVYLGKGEFR